MSTAWLANAYPESFWPHHTWGEFAALSSEMKAKVIVVLPIHGFADHGLGLPLDAEEALGSEVLRRAAEQACAAKVALSVLPPLRFGLAPYPSCRFGIDTETAYEQLREIVKAVKASGFSRIVFFNTSPWNEELVATVALDSRVDWGMENHVANLSKLGVSFHPGASREARANAQAAAAFVLGMTEQELRANVATAAKGDVRDAEFRPGNFQQPEPLTPDELLDGETIVDALVTRLARTLREIDATGSSGMGDSPMCSPPNTAEHGRVAHATQSTSALAAFSNGYRAHYLPAFTAEQLAAIPEKQNALVIIPTGAIEQHGPHLPVGVDAILGQAWLAHALPKLSADIARRVFVAPPITFGKSNEHDGFPGTITISAKTLRHVLLALATELRDMGFRNIAVLNTHGGNSPVIVYTLREIQTALGMRAGMIKAPLSPELSAKEAALGIHAGQWETALMLACAPELVRIDKAVCEYPEHSLDGVAWMTRDVSKSGVMGDARAATAEQGVRWFEKASAALAGRIAELLK